MINLKSLLPQPAPVIPPPLPKIGTYVMGWWGSGSHVGATYKSNNPDTVKRQADLMQAIGIEMVCHVFYGQRETVIYESAKLWAIETAKRGMLFSVMLVNDMFSGITTDWTVYLIDQMKKSPELFQALSYIPEHAIFDFGALKFIDTAKLTAAFPFFVYWREHQDYTWINAPGTRANQVTYERLHRNLATLKAPSIWEGFDDQSITDCTKSVWGGLARRVDGERGNLFLDLCALPIPPTAKYVMFGTWDDYEERTAQEKVWSMATGIRIF